jgi:hypothetical protein
MLRFLYKGNTLKLIIQEDSIGYYLIVYDDPYSEKSSEDYLVNSLDEAFAEAQEKFGVSRKQWRLER